MNVNNLKSVLLIAVFALAVSCDTQTSSVKQSTNSVSKLEYLKGIKKIDAHMHIRSNQQYLIDFMDEWNFKFNTVCVPGSTPKTLQAQRDTAAILYKTKSRYYAWVTGIDMTGFTEPGWTEASIAKLKLDFENGAIGVKVNKIVGMKIIKPNGEYLQIDDPLFTPIFNYIAKESKTLLAHVGEPIHAWTPTYFTKEGVGRNYWAKHPEYSFWDKPELPSYSDIMAARDHVLQRHPDLRFVGAHLGGMEFDVDEIITRFEQYPNFAVELGGRTRYLMWQARGKVQDFFNRYQDRIMYGTDRESLTTMNAEEKESLSNGIRYRNDLFLRYYTTSDDIPWGNIISNDRPRPKSTYTVKGIDLPTEILDKFFYKNAVKWFPGIDKDFR